MLNEGRRRKERGTDVVIGFVECHGRRLTEEMIGDMEVVPRTVVEYRGQPPDELSASEGGRLRISLTGTT
jgi:two-component system, OmpR family, sensor histidine kinase KdpD